jgi:predicted DsbA family dithiol-disulfide isomerase
MEIEIISDVICPWCFIGKRRLERALAARPQEPVTLSWRPFQLNPDMPPTGMARDAYLSAKFGGAAHARRIYTTVAEAGVRENIAFAFDRIRRTPNTLDAHRLIRFAGRGPVTDRIVEALFQAYFIEGRDIGERKTLVEIAGEQGLDPEAVGAFLADDRSLETVRREDQAARQLGINAVPCFILGGRYAISGAQEPEFFLPLFDLARTAQPETVG